MPVTSRSIVAGFALLASAAGFPAIAHAQKSVLEVPATKKWQHAQTGLIVPQASAGLPRTEISDAGQGELDIAVQFGDIEKTQATLYLFRPALMSVPVWFDRVEAQVLHREAYGSAAPIDAPAAFAPPHGTTAAALRRIYKPSKPPFAATAVTVLPLGNWLVVLRISSTEQAPAQLDATLSALIAGLGWPAAAANAAQAPAAIPIQGCPTPLAYNKKAKMQKPDMAAGLMGAMLAMIASKPPKDGEKKDAAPVTFCRDGEGSSEMGVYRALPADDFAYTIAIADAGRTVSVYPDLMSDAKNPGYAVTLNTLDRAYVFPTFDRLPEPAKVLEALSKTRPISSAGRNGNEISIQAQ